MHPFVRRDLPPFRQLDHAHRRGVTALPAKDASNFQIGVSRGRRMASSGKLARVFFKPAKAAQDALANRWRWLFRAAAQADRQRATMAAGSGQSDCGGVPGWKTGQTRRILAA
jgi:hypothetical protein